MLNAKRAMWRFFLSKNEQKRTEGSKVMIVLVGRFPTIFSHSFDRYLPQRGKAHLFLCVITPTENMIFSKNHNFVFSMMTSPLRTIDVFPPTEIELFFFHKFITIGVSDMTSSGGVICDFPQQKFFIFLVGGNKY